MRIFAADLGASKIEFGLWIGKQREWVARSEIKKGIEAEGLIEIISKFSKMHKHDVISLSAPGFVIKGRIVKMPNLPNVDCTKLMDWLKSQRKPNFVENDAKCMALAEWAEGKSADADFLLVAAGSGIGGAIVKDGRLVRGMRNVAGEFGHAKIKNEQGRWVDWESYCAGFGIEKRWKGKRGGRGEMKALEIFRLAKKDLDAQKIVFQAAEIFGAGLASLANALDPAKIVLAGSVAKAYMQDARLRKIMNDAYKKNAILPLKKVGIKCITSPYPALQGAALLAQKENDKRIARFLGI